MNSSKRSIGRKSDVAAPSEPEKAARRLQLDNLNYPPRGMSRDEAARYVGVGTTKFDEMVADRRMPRPKRIDGRVVWDRLRVEASFSDLPDDDRDNPFDRMFSEPGKKVL